MATVIDPLCSPMDVMNPSHTSQAFIQNKSSQIPSSYQKDLKLKYSTKPDPDDRHGLLKESVRLETFSTFSKLLGDCDDSYLHSKNSWNRSNIDDLLRLAVEKNRCNMVETLLCRGGDVNISVNKSSLLEIATKSQNLNLVKLLVKYKADIKAVNVRGETLLFSVIMGEDSVATTNEDVLDYLLKEGVDPNQLSHNGKHPLHVAAIHSSRVINELSGTGCDVNVQDSILGDTPLHTACNRCCEENIMTLLRNGANMNSLNNLGQTPLEKLLAPASGSDFHSRTRRELAKRLMIIGFRVKEPSHVSQRRRNKAVELYKRLKQNQDETPSLKCMCRTEARDHICGINFNQAINKLEIPLSLKRYLSFSDETL